MQQKNNHTHCRREVAQVEKISSGENVYNNNETLLCQQGREYLNNPPED